MSLLKEILKLEKNVHVLKEVKFLVSNALNFQIKYIKVTNDIFLIQILNCRVENDITNENFIKEEERKIKTLLQPNNLKQPPQQQKDKKNVNFSKVNKGPADKSILKKKK